jgi:hypothetical protein
LKTDDPLKAIEMFEMVVDLETKRGDVVKWYVIYIFMKIKTTIHLSAEFDLNK